MSTQRRSPVAPVRAVTTAKTAVRKATPSAALPRLAGIRGGELRRALGHERVGLSHEGSALEFPGEDDLTPTAEGVRDDAAVGDRQALTATVAVGDAEAEFVALAPHRALDDAAGELGARAGCGADQLRGLLRLGRGAERRVDE